VCRERERECRFLPESNFDACHRLSGRQLRGRLTLEI